jgi:hypothetical protein
MQQEKRVSDNDSGQRTVECIVAGRLASGCGCLLTRRVPLSPLSTACSATLYQLMGKNEKTVPTIGQEEERGLALAPTVVFVCARFTELTQRPSCCDCAASALFVSCLAEFRLQRGDDQRAAA